MNKQKGFTLIELLVVVAIIGILAAVVLTSLGSARVKAKNAAIMAQMSSMRAEAELAVTTSGYPADLCTGALDDLRDGIGSQGGGAGATECSSTTSAWVVGAKLLGGEGFYCVDSTGYAGPSTVNPTTETTGTGDNVCDNA